MFYRTNTVKLYRFLVIEFVSFILFQSEPYKSVLTSCVTMKRKTKLVCGTGEGSLITFNTGDYSLYNDEFPCVDKGAAVNKLVPVTENIVISALDNGKIR